MQRKNGSPRRENRFFSLVRRSAAVELDDLPFVDFLRQFGPLGQTNVFAFQVLFVEFEVRMQVVAGFQRFLDHFEAAASFPQADHVAGLARIGRNVYFLAVDRHVAVGHELAGAGAGIGEAETVHQVVKPAFQQDHEVFADDALHFGSAVEQVAELLLAEPVHVAQLLLLHQLHAVAAQLSALSRTVLAGREIAFQFLAGAAQGNAQAPAQFVARSRVTSHGSVCSFSLTCFGDLESMRSTRLGLPGRMCPAAMPTVRAGDNQPLARSVRTGEGEPSRSMYSTSYFIGTANRLSRSGPANMVVGGAFLLYDNAWTTQPIRSNPTSLYHVQTCPTQPG